MSVNIKQRLLKYLGLDDVHDVCTYARTQIEETRNEAKQQHDALTKRIEEVAAQRVTLNNQLQALKKAVSALDANALKKEIDGLRADILNGTIIQGRTTANSQPRRPQSKSSPPLRASFRLVHALGERR
jgi:chromosome segregation ATPase